MASTGPWDDFKAPDTKKEAGPWDAFAQPAQKDPNQEGLDTMGSLKGGLESAGKIGSALMTPVSAASEYVDRYTGAPIRAGLMAASKGQGLGGALSAAGKQFGEPGAPSGADIVEANAKPGYASTPLYETYPKTGNQSIDESLQKANEVVPSKKSVGGLLVDTATNPVNYVPGEKLAEGASALGNKLGSAGTRVLSAASGIPEKEIQTYAQNANQIKEMARSSDNSVQNAADALKEKWNNGIDFKKKELNGQISSALSSANSTIDSKNILNHLESLKGNINKTLRPEEINDVNEIGNKIKSLAGDSGQISLKDAHDLKEYLQEIASPSYSKNGQIFSGGDKFTKTARGLASGLRTEINAAAPQIAEANNSLAELHDIQDLLPRNTLTMEKPASNILAAGSGANEGTAKTLGRLGSLTGQDISGDTEKLAAMRTFGKPALLPVDTTGKSMLRTGLGAGAGYLIGHTPEAAAMGAAVTSPMAVRTLIDTGLLTKKGAAMIQDPATRGLLMKAGVQLPRYNDK